MGFQLSPQLRASSLACWDLHGPPGCCDTLKQGGLAASQGLTSAEQWAGHYGGRGLLGEMPRVCSHRSSSWQWVAMEKGTGS